MRIYSRKKVECAIFHPVTGKHTSTYTSVPANTEFYFASSIGAARMQLWTSDAHGWPMVSVSGPMVRGDWFRLTNERLDA